MSTESCLTCGHSSGPSKPFPTFTGICPSYPDNIEALLKSNSSPSPPDELQIKRLCADIANEIKNLNTEIADTEAKLTALRQQLANKKREASDYKAILSPVRRLPSDLLSEILMLSTNHELDSDTSSLDPTEMHWLLPRVCAHWRCVALSFPRMWSTIRITSRELAHDASGALFRLGVQLHRSGSFPLFVSISSYYNTIPYAPPILQMLLPSSPRWKELYVCLQPEAFSILSPLHMFLPSLTSLRIWTYPIPVDGLEMDSVLSRAFTVCPSLQDLEGAPDILFTSCALPWNQISRYCCIKPHQLSWYLKLLPLLSNLRECFISCDDQLPLDGSHVMVELRDLEYFLVAYVAEHPRPILDHFNFPCLRSLTVILSDEVNSDYVNSLIRFLERSGGSLVTLALSLSTLSVADYLRILEVLPTLKSLFLRCEKDDIDVVGLLDLIIDTPTFVPLLGSLRLDLPSNPYQHWQTAIPRLGEARPGLSLWWSR